MHQSEIPQAGPRSKEEFMELARIMRARLKDMESAVLLYEQAVESIPQDYWPLITANFQRAWHRTEYVKQLDYEARYLQDIARSLKEMSQ